MLRLLLHASLIPGLAVVPLATVPSKLPRQAAKDDHLGIYASEFVSGAAQAARQFMEYQQWWPNGLRRSAMQADGIGRTPMQLLSVAWLQAVDDSQPPFDLAPPLDSDPTKFRDIKPHETISAPPTGGSKTKFLATVVGLVLSLGFLALLLWYRYRRTPDPNELAMAEIDQLESQYTSDPEQACDQLSTLLRRTISANSGVNAMSQTTDQVLETLESFNAPASLLSQVDKLLRLTDESKFGGRAKETNAMNDDVFDRTRSIVRAQATLFAEQAKGDG